MSQQNNNFRRLSRELHCTLKRAHAFAGKVTQVEACIGLITDPKSIGILEHHRAELTAELETANADYMKAIKKATHVIVDHLANQEAQQ